MKEQFFVQRAMKRLALSAVRFVFPAVRFDRA